MKKNIRRGITAAAAVVIILTLLPLIKVPWWWVRIMDYPHLQLLLISLGVLIIAVIYLRHFMRHQKLILLLFFFCFLYKIYKVYPYTVIAPRQTLDAQRAVPENTISLLASNVYMKNRNAEKLIALVRKKNPDIFLAMEVNHWWDKKLEVIEKDYPYRIKKPLENTWGMNLYSKFPLKQSVVEFLTIDTVPSIYSVVQLRQGDKFALHCLHPVPPAPFKDTDERDAELIIVGKRIKNSPLPAIVIGDLNDVAWSYTTNLFQKESRTLDPRRGRGFYNTFHAKIPFFRYPLDYVFHTADFRLVEMERLNNIGSDHFPIYIKLSYEPGIKEEQRKPTPPDENEKEEIEEINQKQNGI